MATKTAAELIGELEAFVYHGRVERDDLTTILKDTISFLEGNPEYVDPEAKKGSYSFVRGTTQEQVFYIDAGGASEVFVTYAQDGWPEPEGPCCYGGLNWVHTVLEKEIGDVIVEEDHIIVNLSQEETLLFKAGKKGYVQVRVKWDDGATAATEIKEFDVGGLLKEGEI